MDAVKLEEAIRRVVAAKEAGGCRRSYTRGLRQYLAAFARGRESRGVGTFGVSDLEEWFAGRMESANTKRANIGRLSALFGYAVRHGWIESNPCERLEPIRIDPEPPLILGVEESERIVRWTVVHAARYLAFLALVLFCGLRVSEARQTSWGDIDVSRGVVTVRAATSKVRRRRVIEVHSTGRAWLESSRSQSQLPLSRAGVRRYLRRLAGVLDRPGWPQNALRHTCASMMVAEQGETARVAFALGNSPGILLRYYHELVSPEQAKAFWAILP